MEREAVCEGGRDGGSRWREEKRGNGLGEERPGEGEGQTCVFVGWGAQYK